MDAVTATGVVTGPDRAAWLARRRAGIGGSDAAAVVGLHPWLSPLGLFFDKTGAVGADTEPTEAMEWGIRLESVVAQAWSEKNQQPIKRFPPYDPANILAHPEHPWMIANLDGLVLADDTSIPFDDTDDVHPVAVLEIKTASGWAAADWDEGVPQYVVIQCMHQMAVTGYERAEVACLVGGSRYVQDTIERDEELIEGLIAAEARFWQQVLDGVPPAVDAHPNTAEVLKARWQDLLADAVELGSEGVSLVKEHHAAKAAAGVANDRLVVVDNEIRMAMGEHEVMTAFGEVAVTWKQDKNGVRRLSVKEII